MSEITFLRYTKIKGINVSLYVFSGNTNEWYQIVTAAGTTIKKRFIRSPQYFATLTPIARYDKVTS